MFLGGYLNHVVLPIAKFAYYGGSLNYENTEKLYQLFDELKCFLRTNGEGWEKPMTITGNILFYILYETCVSLKNIFNV